MRRISLGEVQFWQNNDSFGIYSDLSCELNQGMSSYNGYFLGCMHSFQFPARYLRQSIHLTIDMVLLITTRKLVLWTEI